MSVKVAHMQKITLTLEIGKGAERISAANASPTIEFVYGLGPSGLTPFEFALADKIPGDEIQLKMHRHQMHEFFGHIHIPFAQADQDLDPVVITLCVWDITPASSQEVVRTLAEIANCGDGCCGHH